VVYGLQEQQEQQEQRQALASGALGYLSRGWSASAGAGAGAESEIILEGRTYRLSAGTRARGKGDGGIGGMGEWGAF
jgi:hypothetical protein